eukprot:Nk52_evm6s2118 gene=Nk52_evmTU6s2118
MQNQYRLGAVALAIIALACLNEGASAHPFEKRSSDSVSCSKFCSGRSLQQMHGDDLFKLASVVTPYGNIPYYDTKDKEKYFAIDATNPQDYPGPYGGKRLKSLLAPETTSVIYPQIKGPGAGCVDVTFYVWMYGDDKQDENTFPMLFGQNKQNGHWEKLPYEIDHSEKNIDGWVEYHLHTGQLPHGMQYEALRVEFQERGNPDWSPQVSFVGAYQN